MNEQTVFECGVELKWFVEGSREAVVEKETSCTPLRRTLNLVPAVPPTDFAAKLSHPIPRHLERLLLRHPDPSRKAMPKR